MCSIALAARAGSRSRGCTCNCSSSSSSTRRVSPDCFSPDLSELEKPIQTKRASAGSLSGAALIASPAAARHHWRLLLTRRQKKKRCEAMREAMIEGYKREDGGREHRVRPYHEECTAPHPNSKVKPRPARSVPRWWGTVSAEARHCITEVWNSACVVPFIFLPPPSRLLLGPARCWWVFVSRKPCLLRIANHTIVEELNQRRYSSSRT